MADITAPDLELLNKFFEDTESKTAQKLRTDIASARLAERVRRDSEITGIDDAQLPDCVELVPSMTLDDNGLVCLEFTIGVRRQYVVRDVYALGRAVVTRGVIEYGKGLSVLHDIERFEPGSRALAQFVAEVTARISDVASYLLPGSGIPSSEARRLYVPACDLPRLAAILSGRTIQFSSPEASDVSATFFTEPPDFGFSVREKDGGAVLRHTLGDFRLIESQPYSVLFVLASIPQQADDPTGGCGAESEYGHVGIYDCSGKRAAILSNVLHAYLDNRNGDSLAFSHETVRELSGNILPKLKSVAEVRGKCPRTRKSGSADELALKSRVFLDRPRGRDDTVTAALKFCYGGASGVEIDAYAREIPLSAARIPRDPVGELKMTLLLKKYGFSCTNAADGSVQMSLIGDERIYNLLHSGIPELGAVAEVMVSDSLSKVKVTRPRTPSVNAKLRGGLVQLRVDSAIPPEELAGVLAAYREKKSFHKLRTGDYIAIDDENIGLLSDLSDNLGIDGKTLASGEITLPSYRGVYIDTLCERHPGTEFTQDKSFRSMVDTFERKISTGGDFVTAADGILRPYQRSGVKWMLELAEYSLGGILADEMGLGKTLQVISMLTAKNPDGTYAGAPVKRGKLKPSLIVAPTSLVYNWKTELARFAPEVPVTVVSSTATKRKECINHVTGGVVITSYDALKRDIECYKAKSFRCCIIDEAQYIKNQSTQAAAAVKEIKADCRFALTGTPIENSLSDLWSIFDFILPGYFNTYSHFRRKLEIPITRDGDAAAAAELMEQVKPFILRRTKRDVLRELPDKIESTVYAEMDDEQELIYQAELARAVTEVTNEVTKNGFDQSRMKILSLITRLRQLCCHPSLYLENYAGRSAKLDLCMELLVDGVTTDHRILVFSQFTSMLAIIERELTELGVKTFTLRGDTPCEERQQLVERFNAGEASVFLISLKAGGTGLNLTSADMVIHYDPWWNISAQNQATDRAHRIGQTQNVQVYKLLVKDSIEDKIQELQKRKEEIAKSVITENETFLTNMDKDDILGLFSK